MKTILVFLSMLVVLASCSDPLEDKPKNSNGGTHRNNYFEGYDEFIYQTIETYSYYQPDSSGAATSALILSNTDKAFCTNRGVLVYLSGQDKKWSAPIGADRPPLSDLVADKDLNIYLVNFEGNIISFDKTGNKRWSSKALGEISKIEIINDILALDDGIIIGTSQGKLVKIDFSGNKLWAYYSSNAIGNSICRTESGDIITSILNKLENSQDSLLILSKDGKKLSSTPISNSIIAGPIISNNNIIISSKSADKSYLLRFDLSGKLLWNKEIPFTGFFLASDDKSNIFVSGFNSGTGNAISGIQCYDKDNNFVWKVYLDSRIVAPPMVINQSMAILGTNKFGPGIYYFNTKDGKKYKDFSLTDFEILNHKPSVSTDGSIFLTTSMKTQIVRITESALSRIMPF